VDKWEARLVRRHGFLEGKILDQFFTFVLNFVVALRTTALPLGSTELLTKRITNTLTTEGMSTFRAGNRDGRSEVVAAYFAP